MILKHLGELEFNSEIYVYGAGEKARFFIEQCIKKRLDIKIYGIIDSFKSEGSLCGFDIVNVNDFNEKDKIIIICSMFYADIIKTLSEKKITNFKLYYDQDNSFHVRNEIRLVSEIFVAKQGKNERVAIYDKMQNVSKEESLVISDPFEKNNDIHKFKFLHEYEVYSWDSDILEFIKSKTLIKINLLCFGVESFHLITLVDIILKKTWCKINIINIKNISLKLCYSKKYDFVYVPITKCASSSMDRIVRKSIQDINYTLDYIDLADFSSSFAIVRDPYRRFLSAFIMINDRDPCNILTGFEKTYKNFDEFLNYIKYTPDFFMEMHYKTQSFLINRIKNHDRLNFIKLEEIDTEIPSFFKKFGIEIDLVHKNKNPKKEKLVEELLTEKAISIINERYKDDFERFGYEKLGTK